MYWAWSPYGAGCALKPFGISLHVWNRWSRFMDDSAGHLGVGDRLKTTPAPEMVQSAYALEAGDGPLLYGAMSRADLAHAIMLLEAKIIPLEAGAELLEALLEMHQIPAGEFAFDPSRGDAYSNRE